MTTASHIWRRPATTHEGRAVAAMQEVTRLELAIDGWQHEIDTMVYRDDIPRHQMTMRQNMQIGWAKTELQTARSALQNILKE